MATQTSLIPIGITSTNNQGFSVSASSVNMSPYNMFDGKYDASFLTCYRSSTAPSLPENVTVSFPKSYMINGYTVKVGYADKTYANMATWDFYGLIGGSYVLLHSGTNPSEIANTITGTFSPVVVNGIKIVCKSRYGGNSWGIDELVVYEFNYQYQYLIQDKNNNLFSVNGKINIDNAIPIMTSNTAPSGVASANGNYTTYYPYKAFMIPSGDSCWAIAQTTNGVLQYKFEKAMQISKYTILGQATQPTRSPKSWTFEGSNDGTNWTVLDTQNNITNWTDGAKKEFTFNNLNNYLYYRINISANNGDSTYICIGRLEMYTNDMSFDKLQGTISDTLFINKGIANPTIINNQKPITRGIYGKDNGILGSGKLFEIALDNSVKKINSYSYTPIDDTTEISITENGYDGLTSSNFSHPQVFGYGTQSNVSVESLVTFKVSLNNPCYLTNLYILTTSTSYGSTYYNMVALSGSIDDINYVDLKNNITLNKGDTTISNNIKTAYKYYKISITAVSGSGYPVTGANVSNIKLKGYKSYNKRFLIRYNSQLYTFNGRDIISSPSQILDEDNFKTNGIIDLTAISELPWKMAFQDKSNVKILLWTNKMDTTDAKIIYDCEQYDIAQWLKDNGCNLLMWTDDMTKTSTNMVYNTNLYLPLDSLSDEFEILEYIK